MSDSNGSHSRLAESENKGMLSGMLEPPLIRFGISNPNGPNSEREWNYFPAPITPWRFISKVQAAVELGYQFHQILCKPMVVVVAFYAGLPDGWLQIDKGEWLEFPRSDTGGRETRKWLTWGLG
jgi:hypothetical protein